MKICKRCQADYKPTGNKQKYCIICGPKAKLENERARYRMNRELVLESQRAKYRANPATKLESNRAWVLANLEQARKYRDEWRKSNPVKVKGYSDSWRKANPDKVRARNKAQHKLHPERTLLRNAKRRALLAGSSGLPPLFVSSLRLETCYFPNCNRRASTIDHFYPLSKGGLDEPNNVAGACLPCNSGKRDRDPLQYFVDQYEDAFSAMVAQQDRAWNSAEATR